ncbi:MAG: flagellar hook-length control protein FliK, partial [Candidatus Desulfatibia sp.]|uniref:flagellar hook-length control protein FliK n=1 Tax=Candidatus Desulfatibia sp. TaxID=3101189 RepID=UPI002F2C9F0A
RKIMNAMILKLISSVANQKTANHGQGLKSAHGRGDLFAGILKSLNTAHGQGLKSAHGSRDLFAGILKSLNTAPPKSSLRAKTPWGAGAPINKNRYHTYLESLRKTLLAQGKPLNKVALKNEDLALINKFLRQCGFSKEKVDQFLKELAEKSPGGQINLARFFQEATELAGPQNKKEQGRFLEQAAVPHLELILRDFGLTPQALERVYSAARVAGGRLDPGKFVAKLKQISKHINKEAPDAAAVKIDQQLADKLKMLGIHMPAKAKSGSITLKNFIASLEQMAGGSDGRHKLPPEMQTTMEQILAKVVVPGEKTQITVSKPLVFNPELTDFNSRAQTKKGAKSVEKEQRLSAFKPAGRPGADEKFPAFADEKGKLNADSRPPDLKHANADRAVDPVSEFKGGRGSKPGINTESFNIQSQTIANNISPQMAAAVITEAVRSTGQHQKPFQDFLPTYLVDQVGRQLSRALLRGDRVIRLRLKPPELGTLKIEMDIKDNVLRLGMIVENSAVKELLLSSVHELRNALTEQGVKIEGLDVQVGHDSSHFLANSEEGLKERQRFIKEQERGPLAEEIMMDDSVAGLRNRALGDRLLNIVA